MPNTFDNTGLTIATNSEIKAALIAGLQGIYGADITTDSNSPDGQMVGIFAQVVTDMLELLASVNGSFDPDSCSGSILDQRVAINGITRTAGTYTIAPVSITVSQATTLYGADQSVYPVFTVGDGNGNNVALITTKVFSAAGTSSLSFQAVDIGAVNFAQNTITNMVTIVAYVTTVNNPLVITSLGINEETDAQMKVRRMKSFQLQAGGPADAVLAAILALPGVTDAYVKEDTSAHTLWCIVENGTSADIAAAIYAKKSAGCGLAGDDVTVVVTRPNGQTVSIVFDRPDALNLYIAFSIHPKISGGTFDEAYIKAQLVAQLSYGIGESANSNDIAKLLYAIEPGAIFTAIGVSLTAGSYVEGPLAPTTVQNKFALDVARVAITDV